MTISKIVKLLSICPLCQ